MDSYQGGGGLMDSGRGSLNYTSNIPEIPVTVGGCEKWVTGLTKRTTCDDVIYALLNADSNPNAEVETHAFAIFERWRDMERPLQGRTKILKVWRAWGNEQPNVTFSLRKVNQIKESREVIRSRRHRKPAKERSERRDSSSSREKAPRPAPRHRSSSKGTQKETQKSSNDACSQNATCSSASRLQTLEQLVQKVISQEKVIQDQIGRIQQTDTQIDEYETIMHIHRVRENGVNYVQDAYLKSINLEETLEDIFNDVTHDNMEEYIRACEELFNLEELIKMEETKMDDLSYRILDESINFSSSETTGSESEGARWGLDRVGVKKQLRSHLPSANAPKENNHNDDIVRESSLLKTALKRTMSLSTSQRMELERVNRTLTDWEKQLDMKRDYLLQLEDDIDTLEEDTSADSADLANDSSDFYEQSGDTEAGIFSVLHDEPPAVTPLTTTALDEHTMTQIPYVTVKTFPSFVDKYKDNDNDSNSDTGLSSLHSDDVPSPILETLV